MFYNEEELLEAIDILIEEYGFDEEYAIELIEETLDDEFEDAVDILIEEYGFDEDEAVDLLMEDGLELYNEIKSRIIPSDTLSTVGQLIKTKKDIKKAKKEYKAAEKEWNERKSRFRPGDHASRLYAPWYKSQDEKIEKLRKDGKMTDQEYYALRDDMRKSRRNLMLKRVDNALDTYNVNSKASLKYSTTKGIYEGRKDRYKVLKNDLKDDIKRDKYKIAGTAAVAAGGAIYLAHRANKKRKGKKSLKNRLRRKLRHRGRRRR